MVAKRTALLTVVVLLVVFGGVTASSAAPGLTFNVSPAKLELRAQPGQTVSANIQLLNGSNVPITLGGSVRDYFIRPDNSFVFLRPGATAYSSARWVRLDQNRISLKPHESKSVRLDLRVPGDVEPGGHYAVVFFQNQRTRPRRSGVSVVGRIGVVVLATVGDKVVRQSTIKDFSVTADSLRRQAAPELLFNNTGNVHIHLKGSVIFKDYFGRPVGSQPLPNMTVLPKTDRILTVRWRTPLFGRFTAQAKIMSGLNLARYDRTQVTEPIIFWIIPWPLIIGVLVLLLMAVALAGRRRASRRRSAGSHRRRRVAPKDEEAA